MKIDQLTLGGYTVADLKKMQAAVRKDASKFIADNLKVGTALVEEILEGRENLEEGDEGHMSDDEVRAKGEEAAGILKAVNLVSAVSGVEYYIPWDSQWDSTYSGRLEDTEGLYDLELDSLFSILEDMEYNARNWNESRC